MDAPLVKKPAFILMAFGLNLWHAHSAPPQAPLGGMTVLGVSSDVSPQELESRFGKPVVSVDRTVFNQRSGKCYLFKSVGLEAQYFGGPDGGAVIFGPQLERDGKIIAKRGLLKSKLAEVLKVTEHGPWRFRIVSPVEPARSDWLTVIFDNSGLVRGFKLEYHRSVD